MPVSDWPNVVFVFGDQWRAQALGFAGDPNVKTPNLDAFAAESLRFSHAVSNCPVCSPWRATLMTGQYPQTHGLYVNDTTITSDAVSLGTCFADAGYDTAYIGKWHIDGQGRSAWIPPERRRGFQYWKTNECTHDYWQSLYYADTPEKKYWDGYDAQAQTRDACRYLRERDTGKGNPFFLMLSWGPPHAPYETAPESFRRLYQPDAIQLRPNVPASAAEEARQELAGYYAHCSALDCCFGELMNTLDELALRENTLVVFTSDHGDMLHSQDQTKKQRPWDESILVPMLMRLPACLGTNARTVENPINAPDLMPTLLGLCGLDIPHTVEGSDFSSFLLGQMAEPPDTAALIELPAFFHQYAAHNGGRVWRGLRTERYTYVISRDGPWLLYDNLEDPFQLHNRVADPAYHQIRESLDSELQRRLQARGDTFRSCAEMIAAAGCPVNDAGDPVFIP